MRIDQYRKYLVGKEPFLKVLYRVLSGIIFLLTGLTPAIAYEIPEADYPELPETANSAEAFVPSGWTIEVMATGDLNTDERDDILLALQEDAPENFITNDPASPGVSEWNANPRILAVAFACPAGGYELVFQNNDFIPRHEDPCIDDPFSLAEIDNGAIHIYLHLWANAGTWYTSDSKFSFRYLDDSFRLTAFSNYTTKRNTGETRELNLDYISRKGELTIGNYSSDEDEDTKHERPLPDENLLTIEGIGSGWDFYPEQSDISWWESEESDPFTDEYENLP